MTLAAALSVQNYPVLIGDLLLSGAELSNKVIHVPTIGNISNVFPDGSGYSITGLCQKLCSINDNLVVGWSGTLVAAKIVISQLMKESANRVFVFNDLKSFFENDIDQWCKENLSIIGFNNDGKGIFPFGFNCSVIRIPQFGEARLIGSGTDRLIPLLENFRIPPDYPEINPLEKAVGTVLGISTYMVGEEIATHSGLLHFYGGGFEIMSLVRKTFQKIDDITYMFWHVKDEGDGGIRLSMPKMAVKCCYHKDVLLIKRAEFKGTNAKSATMQCNHKLVHLIGPIYRTIEDKEIDEIKDHRFPTFNSRFICHFFIVEKNDSTFNVLNKVTYSGCSNQSIRFVENNQNLIGIDFSEDFFRSLFFSVKAEVAK